MGMHQLCVWNVQTGGERCTEAKVKVNACKVLLTPDGKQIITGGYDGKLKVWNRETLALLTMEQEHSSWSWVNGVAVSSNGKQMMSGGSKGKIRIWNRLQNHQFNSARITRIYQKHEGKIQLLEFLRGDKFVLSGSTGGAGVKLGLKENLLLIWNPEKDKILATFYLDSPFYNAVLSPSGKYIFLGMEGGKIQKLRIDNLP